MADTIRKSPDYLRTLPTIRVRTPETDGKAMQAYCRNRSFDYQLELKLETEKCRYWLCTRCVGKGFSEWAEGIILLENVKANEAGEHELTPYSAGNLKNYQTFDYVNLLWADLKKLRAEDEAQPHGWERTKRIDELTKELKEAVEIAKQSL